MGIGCRILVGLFEATTRRRWDRYEEELVEESRRVERKKGVVGVLLFAGGRRFCFCA
jgi:hypothetical protein